MPPRPASRSAHARGPGARKGRPGPTRGRTRSPGRGGMGPGPPRRMPRRRHRAWSRKRHPGWAAAWHRRRATGPRPRRASRPARTRCPAGWAGRRIRGPPRPRGPRRWAFEGDPGAPADRARHLAEIADRRQERVALRRVEPPLRPLHGPPARSARLQVREAKSGVHPGSPDSRAGPDHLRSMSEHWSMRLLPFRTTRCVPADSSFMSGGHHTRGRHAVANNLLTGRGPRAQGSAVTSPGTPG